MIFKSDTKPMCCYCEYSSKDNENNLFCSRKNKSVSETDKCRKYRYDIFKKKIIPKKNIDFSKYSKEDFKL